ncbi:nucleotidyltransferase domain-containing protein [Microlunatus phosphovorus]|uniref:nucleotidyltransferase domain-containing protein n=1 Tax=Microlunatus phosphovorus TaxID=29405 RepID=UPI000A071479
MSAILVITMDLSYPMQSVIPNAYGSVLGVLARTTEPLSGRRIAALTRPRFSQSRVNAVLAELGRDGIVDIESRPPAIYYRLNREHIAAQGILALASMWQTLLNRIQAELGEWSIAPIAAWLYGSAARSEADSNSDLDILIVRPDQVPSDEGWQRQIDGLAEQIRRWCGNPCEPLVLTESELRAVVQRDDRLVGELRHDAIHLGGTRPAALLGRAS